MSAFQRKFTNEVRQCDEMERKLRFLNTEIKKAEIEMQPCEAVEASDSQGLCIDRSDSHSSERLRGISDMVDSLGVWYIIIIMKGWVVWYYERVLLSEGMVG